MIEKQSRAFLRKIGMPESDNYGLTESLKRFPDGGQYRFEAPGIQNPMAMKVLLEEADKKGVCIHRVTQTKGIMFLLDEEIEEMVEMARKWKVELLLAIGPRAKTDTSASVHTPEGIGMDFKLRGQEQLIRSMEELLRGVKLGCRYFLLYDEGSLWIFNKMRAMGEIPADCHFKMSAHSGYGNPCSMKFLEEAGANSVNPVWDLQLPMLGAIRQAIDIPMDVHIETTQSTGGFIRYYETPTMIKVAAPLYLKMGGIISNNTDAETVEKNAISLIRKIRLVQRMIDEYYPEAIHSPK